MKVLTSLVIIGIVGISSLMASNYKIDSSHTNVGFKVKHMMISNVNGKFTDFRGFYSLDEKTNQFTSLTGELKTKSLTTQNKDRDAHLKSNAFFDVQKYPKMTLKLIKQKDNIAFVELKIKDITKVIEMDIQGISKNIKDPWGNIRTAFVLEAKIDRQEFNITFNKVLEAGGLMVSNDVKIIIEVEGIAVK